MAGFFITGTDTGVGKTRTTLALMRHFQARGLSVIGMKPVACGAFLQEGLWRNDDALLLLENASLPIEYAKLNIYCFEAPVSPHIAARIEGLEVEVEKIASQCRELERQSDCVLVEGVGGWEVPLNDRERVSGLALRLGFPVVLVVGMKLGCLNHAVLTHDAIIRSGATCHGWIANCVDADFCFLQENIETLNSALSSPCLGILPHCGRELEKVNGSLINRFLSGGR